MQTDNREIRTRLAAIDITLECLDGQQLTTKGRELAVMLMKEQSRLRSRLLDQLVPSRFGAN